MRHIMGKNGAKILAKTPKEQKLFNCYYVARELLGVNILTN